MEEDATLENADAVLPFAEMGRTGYCYYFYIPSKSEKGKNMNNNHWEEKLIDKDSDGQMDIRYRDLDLTNNYWEALYSKPIVKKNAWKEVLVDTDSDGVWDKKMIDRDGDGELETRHSDLDGIPPINEWILLRW